jgi:hypothetical protein
MITSSQYRIFISTLFFLSFTVMTQWANGQTTGGYPGAPFRMGFGAKAMGMANATAAADDGDVVGYQNPALVPFQRVPTAALSVGVLSLDRSLNFLSYTQRLKPAAGLSFGLINAGVDNIEGRDRDGQPTETYSTSENAFLFTFGLKTSDLLSVGVTAKVFYYSLFTNISTTTVGFDVGALYRLSSDLQFGLVVHDLGSKYKWETTSLYGRDGNSTTEYFPVRVRVGTSYAYEPIGIRIGIESEFVRGTTLYRFGVVQMLTDAVALRGGVDQISGARHVSSKPSVGFSFFSSWGEWRPAVHYAFVLEPYAPAALHFISVSISFP